MKLKLFFIGVVNVLACMLIFAQSIDVSSKPLSKYRNVGKRSLQFAVVSAKDENSMKRLANTVLVIELQSKKSKLKDKFYVVDRQKFPVLQLDPKKGSKMLNNILKHAYSGEITWFVMNKPYVLSDVKFDLKEYEQRATLFFRFEKDGKEILSGFKRLDFINESNKLQIFPEYTLSAINPSEPVTTIPSMIYGKINGVVVSGILMNLSKR